MSAGAPRVLTGPGSIERAAATARSSTIFAARLGAFKQANAIFLKAARAARPVDDITDLMCELASDAYLDLVKTPAPDMRAFAEKVDAVAEWNGESRPKQATADAIFADAHALLHGEV